MGFEKTYLWEDPIQSGVIFGSVFVSLISICYYSLISVCAYLSLTALLAVLSLKVYTFVMVNFLKKEVAYNLLAKIGELDLEIPEEKVNSLANDALTKVNSTLLELRRLFLVENMLDSIMFGLSLWVLTYIGSWFNAMTLVLISWVGLFTIPKVYTLNKGQIDPVLDKVKPHFDEISGKLSSEISGKVFAMFPQAKPAEKTE